MNRLKKSIHRWTERQGKKESGPEGKIYKYIYI